MLVSFAYLISQEDKTEILLKEYDQVQQPQLRCFLCFFFLQNCLDVFKLKHIKRCLIFDLSYFCSYFFYCKK